ncbi:hypothetical protein ANCCEY_08321 [Ancylostoma ceylanicum]|uniref:Uncharacterized protein n=1 Tax=Ancylostoma ceylanicum TaxID=53326 RepID=A0A0D6LY78_9BILA|nr:hypothetical protein ANCCEY_08321 [Ancylostoma ceylanicum]
MTSDYAFNFSKVSESKAQASLLHCNRSTHRHCCSALPAQRFISFDNELVVIMRGLVGGYRGFRARFWSDAIEPVVETTEYNTPTPEILTSQGPFTLPPPTTSAAVKSTKDVFPLPSGFVAEKTPLTSGCCYFSSSYFFMNEQVLKDNNVVTRPSQLSAELAESLPYGLDPWGLPGSCSIYSEWSEHSNVLEY